MAHSNPMYVRLKFANCLRSDEHNGFISARYYTLYRSANYCYVVIVFKPYVFLHIFAIYKIHLIVFFKGHDQVLQIIIELTVKNPIQASIVCPSDPKTAMIS